MSASILNGTCVATSLCKKITHEIHLRQQQGYNPPCLAMVLVGDHPASQIYVKNKQKMCHKVGIESRILCFGADIQEEKLLACIEELNADDTVDGILIQLPLPPTIMLAKIIEHIHHDKDVDGFHPYHLGRLAQGNPIIRPCTP